MKAVAQTDYTGDFVTRPAATQANVHRLADVAVHVQVLKGVLGDGTPHVGLAVSGHGVTACDLNLGGFTVGIASGDLHFRVVRVQAVVEGHRQGVKVQVTHYTSQPG